MGTGGASALRVPRWGTPRAAGKPRRGDTAARLRDAESSRKGRMRAQLEDGGRHLGTQFSGFWNSAGTRICGLGHGARRNAALSPKP